ncbi:MULTISPECIES: type II secretion system F family protein [Oleiagrimonas]|uniref:Type II secretion system F family protein n=1 Tax=Oleiagrimonas citrea TaxID=1665687 RepID=A0A846ZLA4_9GAMM|nr:MULTISPECIES: type II secretion system F family protein [Oleiagrimonas]NKZ38602.1 type II secretion system F family protein [Oleiagrimonas citrea]RAP58158.1 type II secretion protein F [Oleiagrimonas sp. MCCC 1A03011]
MNPIILILALTAAGCIGLAFWALYGFIREVPEADRDYQDPLPYGLRMIWPLVNVATHLLGPRLTPDKLEKAHRELQTAGQDFVLSPEQLYGLRLVGAGLAAAFFWVLLLMLDKDKVGLYVTATVLGLVIGWLYPSLWLSERRKRRRRRVIKDLPTFLDFITMSVEAGLNINGGIEQATRKGPNGPLSQEMMRFLRDVRSGLPRSEALTRMAERMDMSQISSLTSALIQADRVGASLGATLRAQAAQRREERFLYAEKLALEAPVKMMMPLVMFFFPLIFLVLGYFIFLRMKQEGVL